MALPVLRVERFIGYSSYVSPPPSGERHELGVLPQHFADMFGWEELAQLISRVYLALPEAERAQAHVFAENYGEAGALEYYASRYALPRVISPHNSFWYWGPGPETGGPIIIIGGTREDHLRVLEDVAQVATTSCAYCMPYERGRPVFVARGWKVPLAEIWPREKRFI
jgi:hypothetical protein